MIQDLQSRGIEAWLVSGDGENTTKAIAKEAGIPHHRGQALPQEKVQIIKGLREKGHCVGMVGDGLNDAAALAQADMGFGLGAGVNLVGESSDFTLMASDPTRILRAIDLAALTHRVIRQNLFFAFSYNGLAIPLAIAGFLNPLIAVLAMFTSSLTVIGNALRISRVYHASPLHRS
jgi:Cu+-exporting ATPase